MSKRFKGKTCAYCALPGASDTADHVLAREFVAVEDRGGIPKVPACAACNGKKATSGRTGRCSKRQLAFASSSSSGEFK